ncbi:hypothetical protein [Flavihumibacter fluvii]|uniref:hypothetical protein n=1 Tax=Flavihumibacter fluvii TaxID=2838157 RepID=UPI001BDEBFAC|nr:hypothetical protein [Flavihumibacter fluvii]ULQ53572.1 hypothetical protein KJS93_04460 [Flavihumibacter fluvii]
MNLKFSGLIAGTALVALSSCSSLYKSGQTPDDVYFSPGKPAAAVVKGDDYQEASPRNGSSRKNAPYDDYSYRDDRYLRLMISAGYYPGSYYSGYAMMMDPWLYNNWRWNSYMIWNSGFNSPWNSMWYWNSFYNPYCAPVYYYPGKGGYGGNGGYSIPRPSRPASAFSMSSYLNTNGTNNRSGYSTGKYYSNSYNNSNGTRNSNYNSSNNRRSLFGGNTNNSNNSSYERTSRSYTPSNNSGSSGSRSSSGSSGGGGVSRPTRTGGN